MAFILKNVGERVSVVFWVIYL